MASIPPFGNTLEEERKRNTPRSLSDFLPYLPSWGMPKTPTDPTAGLWATGSMPQDRIFEDQPLPGVFDPQEAGQKRSLGFFDGFDPEPITPPPPSPGAAPAFPGNPARPQGFSAAEIAENNRQVQERMKAMQPPAAQPAFDPMEAGQKKALGDDSYIRFDPDGAGPMPMQDLAPRGSDTRGYSEMDWSKVANPMAFEAYRERPEIAAMERATKDPLWVEREKAGIDMGKQLGAYQGMRDIDRAEMAARGQAFVAAMQQKDAEYTSTKAKLAAKFSGPILEEKLARLEADHEAALERLKTSHGFGSGAKNEAFEGIGRR